LQTWPCSTFRCSGHIACPHDSVHCLLIHIFSLQMHGKPLLPSTATAGDATTAKPTIVPFGTFLYNLSRRLVTATFIVYAIHVICYFEGPLAFVMRSIGSVSVPPFLIANHLLRGLPAYHRHPDITRSSTHKATILPSVTYTLHTFDSTRHLPAWFGNPAVVGASPFDYALPAEWKTLASWHFLLNDFNTGERAA